MRDYWEDRARINAAFYVDTSLDYHAPDMQQFAETGRRVVQIALDEPPAVTPARTDHAVEIGCGLGRICRALAERFDHVVGVDISAEMLAQAAATVDDRRVEFRRTDGATLPGVDDASVDLVLSFTVFQHIPSLDVIRSYVGEAGRVLRPGGVFVVQWNGTPGVRRWQAHRLLRATLRRLGRGDRLGRDAREFLGCRIPLQQMDEMLAAAGLGRVAVRDAGTLFTWAWAVKGE